MASTPTMIWLYVLWHVAWLVAFALMLRRMDINVETDLGAEAQGEEH
jgi:hypothetical protein